MESEHHDYDITDVHSVYERNVSCFVCRRNFQPEVETDEAFDVMSICRDCKTSVFDDLGTTIVRRQSSESVEDLFLQEFSQLINLARQNRETHLEGGTAQTVSSTSRDRSIRWRRTLSDNESDGLDQVDSLFAESDSNFSFGVYGGESDASVDGPSFLDREVFIHLDDESRIVTDIGIDPMHTGLDPWNSDDQDEDGEEWEDTNFDEEVTPEVDPSHQIRDASGSPVANRARVHWISQEDGFLPYPSIFSDLEESDLYIQSGDYLNGRGLEEGPPASSSFVENLPRVVFSEDHEKNGGLICAICKDPLLTGTQVSQLPCLHFYHPSCILPWLSSRNSCPLCRYELPTDDPDYEQGKRHLSSGPMELTEIRDEELPRKEVSDLGLERQETMGSGEDDPSDPRHSSRGGAGGGWLLLAAAPIVGIVGAVLVLWLGKPLTRGGGSLRSHGGWGDQIPRVSSTNDSAQASGNGRNRRWWPFF
ncbi:unnamed protein product [Spirodela intermedia]|uniref:RING-type E3 ubiquitin transferase n=1 Tax=Spirodela intermedia TaxID=51605 RepID=A0A7I8IV66_SPIIN|nr:unnamed protein product [Spirodela intermedia]CAA6661895.1 unnamed protein product [Spirodela intermedia]